MSDERYWGRCQGRRRMRHPCRDGHRSDGECLCRTDPANFTPVHVDEEYAKTTPFGTRVAHGLFGLSLADGLKTRADYRFLPGMSLGWTWDFQAADQARRYRAREVPRWFNAHHEAGRVGHRGATLRADQSTRRSGAARRAPADDSDAPEDQRRRRAGMTAQDLPLQNLPLKGIRVIDYSHFLAGPFMGRCLAAMGAEVIKVERPKQGDAGRAHGYFKDGQSGYFLQQNMGKQGLCIDLRDKRGLDMMMKLIDTADVFIENYRPRRARAPRAWLQGALGAESQTDLLLGFRLWPHRSLCRPPGLRPDRRGECRALWRNWAIPVKRRRCCGCHWPICTPAFTAWLPSTPRWCGRGVVRTRPTHRSGAVRLHGLDARLCGSALLPLRRYRPAEADWKRTAGLDRLRRSFRQRTAILSSPRRSMMRGDDWRA